ncbi:MAG: hypothetical protein HY606_07625 [Planctomycetes bacterium]|nr:hypothetical protein [Planctomycetota bacterium]
MRHQIQVINRDLRELIQELTERLLGIISVDRRHRIYSVLSSHIFNQCKKIISRYVRGMHVCGCQRHCELRFLTTGVDGSLNLRPISKHRLSHSKLHGYIYCFDIPSDSFVRHLQKLFMFDLASQTQITLNPEQLNFVISNIVKSIFTRYDYFSPVCNKGLYICEVGSCIDFDPLTRIKSVKKIAKRKPELKFVK